jgi:hypothetical protein
MTVFGAIEAAETPFEFTVATGFQSLQSFAIAWVICRPIQELPLMVAINSMAIKKLIQAAPVGPNIFSNTMVAT